MLTWLLSLALQDQILGWTCSAERTVDGRVYRLTQSIEGQHTYPRDFRINWMSAPFSVDRFVEWLDIEGMPPQEPRTINFSVPISRRPSRALLRIILPDGTERLLPNDPARWTLLPSSAHGLNFQSLDRDLNRQLWTARHFRAVAEDRRGRVLGMLNISFPDPGEASGMAAKLAREVDAKLGDPANPANQCNPYGEEAYADPA